jgi:hypothetical protein
VQYIAIRADITHRERADEQTAHALAISQYQESDVHRAYLLGPMAF